MSRRRDSEERAWMRAAIVWTLGLLGVALALGVNFVASRAEPPTVLRFVQVAVVLHGAIAATLLVDLVASALRRRPLSTLLARATLLCISAIFFVAELVAVLAVYSLQR